MIEVNISVILPVYQPTQQELIRSLGSIPLNTSCKCEVILVDDGNDRDTKELIWKICSYYPQVLVLSKEHEGLSKARAYGAGYARGSYVTFMDQGDEIEAGALDKVWEILEKRRPKLFIVGTMEDQRYPRLEEDALPIQVLPDQVLRFGPEAGIPLERLRMYFMTQRDSLLSQKGVWISTGVTGRFLERSFCLENPFPEKVPFGEDLLWNLSLLRTTRQPLLSLLPVYLKRTKEKKEKISFVENYPRRLAVYFTYLRRELKDWPQESRVTYYAHCVRYFSALCQEYVFASKDGKQKERFLTELHSDMWQKVFARVRLSDLSTKDKTMVALVAGGMEDALFTLCKVTCRKG